jgi:hypothetical protein
MSSTTQSAYVDMPIPELVKALCDHAQPGSKLHEEIKGALNAALVSQLASSIDRHERAATCLSNQLLWLNVILGVFTIVGTVLTIWSLLKT